MQAIPKQATCACLYLAIPALYRIVCLTCVLKMFAYGKVTSSRKYCKQAEKEDWLDETQCQHWLDPSWKEGENLQW